MQWSVSYVDMYHLEIVILGLESPVSLKNIHTCHSFHTEIQKIGIFWKSQSQSYLEPSIYWYRKIFAKKLDHFKLFSGATSRKIFFFEKIAIKSPKIARFQKNWQFSKYPVFWILVNPRSMGQILPIYGWNEWQLCS